MYHVAIRPQQGGKVWEGDVPSSVPSTEAKSTSIL